MPSQKFKYVGRHAEILSDGRSIAPGSEVSHVDEKADARLIEEGLLIPAATGRSRSKPKSADADDNDSKGDDA